MHVTDAAGLVRSAAYDYRVLKPNLITDANGNQTAVSYTALGLPASLAAMGKPGEQVGDTTDHPGTWFSYGLTAYDADPSDPQPVWVQTVKRVDHAWTLINALAQELGRPPTPAEIATLLPPGELDINPERFMQRCRLLRRRRTPAPESQPGRPARRRRPRPTGGPDAPSSAQ